MPPRKITRFHFDISESGITVKDVMEAIKKKIMEIKNYGDQSYGDMVACKIEPNGQSYLVPDNIVLESYSQLNDFTILEIPGEINKQLEQKLVIAIVNYVFDGKIFGEPYIAYFYKDLTYEQLSFELMRNGEFLLPQPSYKINLDFKLVLLNSANGSVYYSFQETDGNVYCPQTSEEFDSTTLQPLSGRGTIKNTKIVNNPEELDMSPYCINGDIYDLSCVIYHHGFQFSSGHYTAATRNFIDKKWRLFDDNRVSEKSQNEICESDCTYMLFYQRRRSNDWFPDGVPNKIIEKYQRITEGDDREKNRQRNNYSQMNRKNSRHFGNY
uniref:USP domain-containing protein n=1 Tax=Meloidogyne javanica TaxID=6303 RepID=A0A915LL48_MELJA